METLGLAPTEDATASIVTLARHDRLLVAQGGQPVLHDAVDGVAGLWDHTSATATSVTYSSWGNYTAGTPTNPLTPGYTGHLFDTNSGLVYGKARWYAPELGRWMSEDPVGPEGRLETPNALTAWGYANGNPLRYVDVDGKWPTAQHNIMIEEAFPGLSKGQQGILKRASLNTDFFNKVDAGNGILVDPQDPAASFVHGMSNGLTKQERSQAEAMGDAFMKEQEDEARRIQAIWVASGHKGISPEALRHFGNAMHTVMDRTSPAHEGNQPWNGTSFTQLPRMALHGLREFYARPVQREIPENRMREHFSDVFGPEQLQSAVPSQATIRKSFLRTFGEILYKRATQVPREVYKQAVHVFDNIPPTSKNGD